MRAQRTPEAAIPRLSWLLALCLALSPATVLAQNTAASIATGAKPVIASGMVPDEATRAAILQRLRELYGAQRVVDRISVEAVIAPPNWRDRVVDMLGPDLKAVSDGELAIDGNSVRITGQVSNEAARQQVASAIATAAGPTYVLKNSLVGGEGNKQDVLDAALADRIIEFKSGSATLTDGGRAILDEMAVALSSVSGQQVQVIGHTDDVGARAANIGLSLQRAIAVKAYLEQHGVSADTLGVQGFGPDRPAASNDSEDGRARNRRIEFRVL